MENDKQDKVYWHDGFYAALQLEFHDYTEVLTFEDRHQLSKEALEMDVLIIKKAADARIEKNIGRIFRGHNIFEYKSEKDNLSVWDYNKVMGYAFIYSAFEEIPIEDITISFALTQKPVKLLGRLKNTGGLKIEERSPGIYYVEGDVFPVQIIESKKLTASENVFLKNLRMSEVRWHDVAYKHFKKNGWIDRDLEERAQETVREVALEMLKRGFDAKEVADIVKMPLEWVQSLPTS